MRVLLAAVVLLAGCATSSSPLSVSLQSASQAETEKAVKLALLGRGWKTETERPGYIEASHSDAFQTVRVGVTYSANSASVAVIGGGGDTPNGRRFDPASDSDGWVRNLANDIPIQLARAQILR